MTPLMRLAAVAVPAALVAGYVIGHNLGARVERAARVRRQRAAERRLIRHESSTHPAGSLLPGATDCPMCKHPWRGHDNDWCELVGRLTAEDAR